MSNKKILLVISLFFLFLIFANILINAQENVPFSEEAENLENIGENVPENQEEASVLLQRWREMFLRNPVGKVLVKIWDFLKKPLTIIIGTEAEISWKFLIALGLWIAFLCIAVNMLSFSPLSGWVRFAISFIIVLMMALTKQIDTLAGAIDSFLGKWWGKLAIVIVIIGLIVVSGVLGKIAKERKKQEEKNKEELNRMKLEAGAKMSEEMGKGFKE